MDGSPTHLFRNINVRHRASHQNNTAAFTHSYDSQFCLFQNNCCTEESKAMEGFSDIWKFLEFVLTICFSSAWLVSISPSRLSKCPDFLLISFHLPNVLCQKFDYHTVQLQVNRADQYQAANHWLCTSLFTFSYRLGKHPNVRRLTGGACRTSGINAFGETVGQI